MTPLRQELVKEIKWLINSGEYRKLQIIKSKDGKHQLADDSAKLEIMTDALNESSPDELLGFLIQAYKNPIPDTEKDLDKIVKEAEAQMIDTVKKLN